MRTSFVAALLFCASISGQPTAAQSPKPPTESQPGQAVAADLAGLDEFITRNMREWKVPGLAIAIVKDGQVIHCRGYGYRDVEKQLPVTPRTLFAIGSISKSFTVTGLGMLADEGKLDWDKPVRTYLPEFQLHDQVATEQMTARDLVTHRSGLPRHDGVWYFDAGRGRTELFNGLRYLEPNRAFRSTWQYQNLMYLTAGVLCERLAGVSWEEFTRRRIIEPLGMERTNFSVNDSQRADDCAQPYIKVKDDVKQVPFRNIDAMGPAGSINSNVEAMIRYVAFHIHEGAHGGKQLLSATCSAQMRTPQMIMPPATQSQQHEELGDMSYGMGFMLNHYRGTRYVEHGGSIDGFVSSLSYLPRKKAGVIVLTNLSGVNPVPTIVTRRVYDLLLGQEPVDWSGRIREQQRKNLAAADESKKTSESDRKQGTSPSHGLDDYAGRYEHPAYGMVTIERAGAVLKLITSGGLGAALHHYHYDVFESDEDPTGRFDQRKVAFSYNSRGDLNLLAVQFEPNVADILFERVPDEKMRDMSFLGPLIGEYQNGSQIMAVALKNDSTLMLTVPGQPTCELLPVREATFDLKGMFGCSVTFKKDSSGGVVELVFHQPNTTIVAKRRPSQPAVATVSPAFSKPRVAADQPAEASGYRQPPPLIREILEAPPPPSLSLDPTRKRLLLVQGVNDPPVADLAEPMLGLAGLRINPRTNGPHRAPRVIGLTLQEIHAGHPQSLAVPAAARLGFPLWSPDGLRFAATNTLQTGVELWIGNALTGELTLVPDLRLNLAYGDPVQWMPDSQSLLCQSVVANRGPPPSAPLAPPGPTIEESFGKKGSVRTFQDLLKSAHDEELFDYYARSQLVLLQVSGNRVERVGQPAVIRSAEPSPDGNRLLVVSNHRPYSYLHTSSAFPQEVEVWDRSGNREFRLASLPLADEVPIEGVPTGPRGIHWRPTEPATLVWAEALDDGDPKTKVPHRDRLLMLQAPFAGEARVLAKLEHRFSGITWAERDGLAFLRDYDRDRRWGRTFLVNVDQPDLPARLIWDRSVQDRYNDPGTPVLRTLPNGRNVVRQNGDSIYLTGLGASALGDRPFLDRLDLKSLKSDRLFHCAENGYESIVGLVDDDASRFITRRESATDPPNYFLHLPDGERQLTNFPDPAPQLRGIQKQLVTYSRHDGVLLSFTLYLPADYKPGQRLPTIVWAYPREFTGADTAGQVTGSPHRFTRIGGISHLFLVTQGYAVLDGATMPVVGDPRTANNSYVEQIVASAQAAIDKAVEMGVTDRNRVGVGGHSYGAFMTANLLAHSDLFRAGVARSGAYNRTLTPFGFQSERRTLWEAPEIYHQVSPFMHAHLINEPILLIHGAMDDNSGTFPMQSERFYQAIRGNGGQVRFVSLPHESHGYLARESVQHTLYEMITWFDKYVKNAPSPVPVAAEKAPQE